MIYLDNAATSFPKPRRVIDEQARCMRLYCGNPGRGSHALSLAASEKIYECRTEAASLFGSRFPENVIFTMNTTMSINTVIKGNLKSGDHVLLSDMEHNAVLRPILKLARAGLISYDVYPTFPDDPSRRDAYICEAIERLISGRTTLMIAHRLSTLRKANKIIVIDRGRVIEFGSHDELMALKGKYYRLIEIQSMGKQRDDLTVPS